MQTFGSRQFFVTIYDQIVFWAKLELGSDSFYFYFKSKALSE